MARREPVAQENVTLPGTVPERDLYLLNREPQSGLELKRMIPFEPKESDDEADKKKLPTNYEIWFEFVNNTSLHGIRYIFWRRPLWARVGWLLVLLMFSAYFSFTAYKSLEKYFNHPINTVITQKYVNAMDFPAVSICPLNSVSKKKMYALDGDINFTKYGLNNSVCAATESARKGLPCGAAMLCCCLSFFIYDGGNLVPNCTASLAQSLIAAQQNSGEFFDSVKFYEKYGQSVDEMLWPEVCIFNGEVNEPCGSGDFTPTVTDWGLCHTFNAGQGNIKKTQISGPAGGLNIWLDSQTDDYTLARLSEGFSVVIHQQGEFINPFDGINVSPGTQATIILHQKRIVNLQDPYETKCKNKKLKTISNYTITGCQFECLQEAIIENCKCRFATYSAPAIRPCAKYDAPCIQYLTSQLDVTKCDCPNPCNEMRYTTEVYYSKFPDAGTANLLQPNGDESTLKYLRENTVFLQIGYKSLSYELHEQKVAFGIEALFGEIGGNMGLFLGGSLMTIFEFADLLVAIFYVRAFHREYPT